MEKLFSLIGSVKEGIKKFVDGLEQDRQSIILTHRVVLWAALTTLSLGSYYLFTACPKEYNQGMLCTIITFLYLFTSLRVISKRITLHNFLYQVFYVFFLYMLGRSFCVVNGIGTSAPLYQCYLYAFALIYLICSWAKMYFKW